MKKLSRDQSKGFASGWERARLDLPRRRYMELRSTLMAGFGITSDSAWRRRLSGGFYTSPAERIFVTDTFRSFGIQDPFGLEAEKAETVIA